MGLCLPTCPDSRHKTCNRNKTRRRWDSPLADRRMLRLICKWLRAGVIEQERWKATEAGTPQGATLSPLLANIYLHYVLDTWAQHWRQKHARGTVILVRYADDFVMGFEHRDEAEQFLTLLRQRMASFGLE